MMRTSIYVLWITIIFVSGCATKTTEETNQSKEIDTYAVEEKDENMQTIQALLTHEFTGPTKDLQEILKDYGEEDEATIELRTYTEKHYKPLIEDYQRYEMMYGLVWLQTAYYNGYQMSVESIDINKVETKNTAYDFKVKVLYKKEGREDKAANVTGRINVNDGGKITILRNINDHGLRESMQNMKPPKQE